MSCSATGARVHSRAPAVIPHSTQSAYNALCVHASAAGALALTVAKSNIGKILVTWFSSISQSIEPYIMLSLVRQHFIVKTYKSLALSISEVTSTYYECQLLYHDSCASGACTYATHTSRLSHNHNVDSHTYNPRARPNHTDTFNSPAQVGAKRGQGCVRPLFSPIRARCLIRARLVASIKSFLTSPARRAPAALHKCN
jgi:hypothetical protein